MQTVQPEIRFQALIAAVMKSCREVPFRRNISHAACSMLVSCLVYSLTLKIEETCSSETSVDFQRTKRRYIPEDRTLLNHRCGNLKSYRILIVGLKGIWKKAARTFFVVPFPGICIEVLG
jgi:hypothetical protein